MCINYVAKTSKSILSTMLFACLVSFTADLNKPLQRPFTFFHLQSVHNLSSKWQILMHFTFGSNFIQLIVYWWFHFVARNCKNLKLSMYNYLKLIQTKILYFHFLVHHVKFVSFWTHFLHWTIIKKSCPNLCMCLTHYQMTNFRLFQTERVCRRQFQIWWKWRKVIQMGRKHSGKRRNCSFLFPQCFQKACFPGAS